MTILNTFGGQTIKEPTGLVSFIDAPILILISVLLIFIFFLKRKSFRKEDNQSKNEFIEEKSHIMLAELDVLMQQKNPSINESLLPFSNYEIKTNYVWNGMMFVIFISIFIGLIYLLFN